MRNGSALRAADITEGMSENTQRFAGRALEYARYRRAYPAEKILGWLHMRVRSATGN